MKRRHRQEVGSLDHHDEIIDPDNVVPQKKCKRTQKLRNICLLLSAAAIIAKSACARISTARTTTSAISVSYVPPTNVTNPLLATFEKIMSSPDLSLPHDFSAYVPLILEDGKILCRGSHKDVISKARIRAFVEMLNKGFETSKDLIHLEKSRSLPILLIESDNSGCYNSGHVDKVPFPRLTWHTPSPKHGSGWCQAISMTGYESWYSFRNMHAYHDSWFFDYTWDSMFQEYERKYPWKSKISKAIWRGSTTGLKRLEFNDTFDELPRAKLVKKSIDRPDIIDAGFTSFVQGWELIHEDLLNETIASSYIPFEDLMKYKAIIDIDGNTWSSRFTKLLCTNSVVIKIDPDYIEHFYADLEPMIHFVPASLQNITKVSEYVLDDNNQHEMKAIIRSANSWCKGINTKEQLPLDAISQLLKYESALEEAYNDSGWDKDWRDVERRIQNHIGEDMVDCTIV